MRSQQPLRSQYDVFLQIVDSGSISKACAELNVSQPSLSKQLRRLEEELKVELFERSASGVKLTTYGEALVGPARAMRNADQSARMIVERLRQTLSGHLAFGVSLPLTVNVMPFVAAELLVTAPGLKLSVVEEQPASLLGRLRRREIEFAVCGRVSGFDDDLVAHDLFDDECFVLAGAGHEVFRRGRIDAEMLLEFHWVGARSIFEGRLQPKFLDLGLPAPALRLETLSVANNVSLTESGKFITFLPTTAVRAQLARGTIKPVLPELFSSTMHFKAVHRKETVLSPGARIVLEAFNSADRHLNDPGRRQ